MADIRRMTAAVTLACLFTEWLCYVLGRLHSSYVPHRIELLSKTLVNDDFSADVRRLIRVTTKAQRKRLSTSKVFKLEDMKRSSVSNEC